jgi:hypothetical protein
VQRAAPHDIQPHDIHWKLGIRAGAPRLASFVADRRISL